MKRTRGNGRAKKLEGKCRHYAHFFQFSLLAFSKNNEKKFKVALCLFFRFHCEESQSSILLIFQFSLLPIKNPPREMKKEQSA